MPESTGRLNVKGICRGSRSWWRGKRLEPGSQSADGDINPNSIQTDVLKDVWTTHTGNSDHLTFLPPKQTGKPSPSYLYSSSRVCWASFRRHPEVVAVAS